MDSKTTPGRSWYAVENPCHRYMEDMVAKVQIRLPRKWRIDASLYCSVAVCWMVFVGVMIFYDLDQTSCHFTNFLMTFWLRYTFHCWISATHRAQIPRPYFRKKQHAGPWTLARQGAELLQRRRELPVRWRHRSKSWYLSIKIAAKIIFISPKQGIVLIRAFWSIPFFGLWGAQLSNKSPPKWWGCV